MRAARVKKVRHESPGELGVVVWLMKTDVIPLRRTAAGLSDVTTTRMMRPPTDW